MYVAALWRYPIKSLGGEALTHADLTSNGIAGDRIVHVRGGRGPLTGRTRHGLVTIAGSTGPDGLPRVNGHTWDSVEALEAVRAEAGPDAHLIAYGGPERFDIGNLLVATDSAVAAFGHDVRRLRPNILIGGVDLDAEATWPEHALVIGDALVGLHSLRVRCVVTSIDPVTGEVDVGVMRHIRRRFNGELALNAWVSRPGRISVGDPVELVRSDEPPPHLGGWIVGAPYLASEQDA
jgi:MOSC domain-containing protein